MTHNDDRVFTTESQRSEREQKRWFSFRKLVPECIDVFRSSFAECIVPTLVGEEDELNSHPTSASSVVNQIRRWF